MLRLGLPGVVTGAPTGGRRWTVPEPLFFLGIRIRARGIGRRSGQLRSPSASLDVDSKIAGADFRAGDEPRSELQRLQAEAESTSSEAIGARMRLMRLVEVAEQLQKQAASKVEAGKENDARELLLQKKNIMLALEKSKNRIELLDKLTAKLNEAILLKEIELIGKVSLHSSPTAENTDSPVRVMSPRMVEDERLQENKACESLDSCSEKVPDLEPEEYQMPNSTIESAACSVVEKPNADTLNTAIGVFPTYKSFIEHVDGQLEGVQDDLFTYLRLSNFLTENEQRNKDFQDILDILQDVSHLRKRVAKVIQSKW